MKVSFVVPVFNTNHRILQICINSILHSIIGRHELIIVDDGSTNNETIGFVERCRTDKNYNITVLSNSDNRGVSYSLNRAIDAATGRYIAPVDHDDLVIQSGFQIAVKHLEYYDCEWAYTNEMQVDAKGYLIRGLYKPAYSKQLLRSTMYINHLQIFSKNLFETVGGYREGYEGSQDHDLALRMTNFCEPKHVPYFAYQWRIMKKTQSRQDWAVSSHSVNSSIKALKDYYHDLGKQHHIEVAKKGFAVYKCRSLPKIMPTFSIIIPTKLGTTRTIDGSTIELLDQCLNSISETLSQNNEIDSEVYSFECLLIVNEDDDLNYGQVILDKHRLPGRPIRDSGNFNFSRKCNLGAEQAFGEILIFLNDDTKIISTNWITDIVSLLSDNETACVGGMLLNPDGTVQSCGDNVSLNSAIHYNPHPDPSSEGDPMHRYWADHETTSITGAFLSCRKNLFFEVGPFNEAFSNSFQDIDFCLRVGDRGLNCVISPHIKIIHYESSTRNPTVDIETIEALRSFHQLTMYGKGKYSLWAYQPIKVRWFSKSGAIHYLGKLRNLGFKIIKDLLRLYPYPRRRIKFFIK